MSEDGGKPEGKTGVSITVSERTTSRVADALLDAFSPITEGLGAIGDRVRVYRQTSLTKTLERAKQLAAEERRQLEPPPPKFLIPYIESASLEDDADTVLREKWARLLVHAGKQPDSFAYAARNLLSEISSNEAKVLDGLVAHTKLTQFDNFDSYREDCLARLAMLVAPLHGQADLLIAGRTNEFNVAAEIGDEIKKIDRVVVVGWVIMLIARGGADVDFSRFTSPSYDRDRHHYQVVEARRLLEPLSYTPEYPVGSWKTSRVSSIEYLRFTQLGFGVVRKLYSSQR